MTTGTTNRTKVKQGYQKKLSKDDLRDYIKKQALNVALRNTNGISKNFMNITDWSNQLCNDEKLCKQLMGFLYDAGCYKPDFEIGVIEKDHGLIIDARCSSASAGSNQTTFNSRELHLISEIGERYFYALVSLYRLWLPKLTSKYPELFTYLQNDSILVFPLRSKDLEKWKQCYDNVRVMAFELSRLKTKAV